MSDQSDTGTNTAPEPGSTPDSNSVKVQRVVDRVSNTEFNEWYAEQQFETNILEGKEYFNGPTPVKEPERHTPSKLLVCHRKASYDRQNAPREDTPPEGLFWVGEKFEEEIIVPFLQDIVPADLYVQNSLWLDTTIEAGDHDVRLRGSTDPAIVTEDADPVFLTEIKTTTSLDHLSEPKRHHKAQLHAYLYVLDQEHDFSITDGLLVYGSRKTLDITVFPVTFDPVFWDTVVTWMQEQTEYEKQGELPPADPERDWECSYCSFRHRCGQTDTPYSDIGSDGFLPLFDGYDRKSVVEYLEAHSDVGAKLTPVLAQTFPDLVERYGAYEWSCPGCSETWAWDAVDWGGDPTNPPLCPACAAEDKLMTLSGPEPENQH
uniref:CRISPR-associated protein Cas4 n=1 Tax=Halobacterium sp. (strain GN101) TaxID=88773 RepID=UPI00159EDA03|nr:PD-(D/E)XK nuclease family protein [Halobacterium sp. GN101]